MENLKLPKKSDIKDKIPDKKTLEDLFFRGYHSKRKIELMEKSIRKRRDEMRILDKAQIMKKYRTHELMISNTHMHINAEFKKFKKLFDV